MSEAELPEPELFEKLESERYFTVDEKVLHISKRLSRLRSCRFSVMFDDCRSRGEIVATFLALLEMVKSGSVSVLREGDETYLEMQPEEMQI